MSGAAARTGILIKKEIKKKEKCMEKRIVDNNDNSVGKWKVNIKMSGINGKYRLEAYLRNENNY